jgi:isoleucyl-tRNA synthetase
MTPDKEAAYMTLYTVLESLCRLTAPFTPFMAEQMYQNLVRAVNDKAPVSVHLCEYPKTDASFIDTEMEKNMGKVLDIVVLGRSARNAANIKNRQPIGRMLVQSEALPESYVSVIAEELNVKNVEFVSDASGFISYKVKPQLKTLGPRYGKLLPKINEALQAEGMGDRVVAAHSSGKKFEFDVEGTAVSLDRDDVLTETRQREGFVTMTERALSVVLDTNMTPELIEEGFVREIVSKVQTMRKEAGFEVTDHIRLSHTGSRCLEDVFLKYSADIAGDTLADRIENGIAGGFVKEWDINGENVTLSVEKL